MDRRFPLIWALIVTCAVLALPGAAIAQNKPQKQDEGFALMHMLKQGEVVRYKIVQQVTGNRTMPGATRGSEIECELTSVIRLRCVKANKDGSLELAAETESCSVKMGKREPRDVVPPKEARTYRIDQYGKPVEPKDSSKTKADPVIRSVLDAVWLESLVVVPNFPEMGLKAGSAWSTDVANPLKTDDKIKVSAKLEELKQVNDGWVSTIKETIGAPDGQGPDNPGVPGCRLGGQITLKFLADKGRMFSAEGTLGSDNRMSVAVPGLPRSDLPTGAATSMKTESLSSKFTVETLPPAPVSKQSGRK